MKKRICTVLAVALALTLAACGGSTAESPSGAASSAAAAGSEAADQTPADEAADITLAEQVLLEEQGVTVTATDITYDQELQRYCIGLAIENQSGQGVNILQNSEAYVNGYYASANLYPPEDEYNTSPEGYPMANSARVPDGETAQARLLAPTGALFDPPVQLLIQFSFYEWDGQSVSYPDYSQEPLYQSEYLKIVTSLDGTVPVDPVPQGEEVYRDENVLLTVEGLVCMDSTMFPEDVKDSYNFLLNVKNLTEQGLTVDIVNVSVNDFMLSDRYLYTRTVLPQTVANFGPQISTAEYKEIGIESAEDIETLEFQLTIRDAETGDIIATTDPITVDGAYLAEHFMHYDEWMASYNGR